MSDTDSSPKKLSEFQHIDSLEIHAVNPTHGPSPGFDIVIRQGDKLFTATEVEFREADVYSTPVPIIPARASAVHNIAERLMDQLWSIGVRPTKPAVDQGDHIQDLRSVVDRLFNLIEPSGGNQSE